MKSRSWGTLVTILISLMVPELAMATPSTTFWPPSTPALQPFPVLHVTYDTYFQKSAAYPVDAGLEMGLLPSKILQAEAGFDLLYPTFSPQGALDAPVLLNAKLGAAENAYFQGSPGWSAGIFGLGFKKDVTDYNVLHAMVGKTFPVGSLAAGGYYGLNEKLLRSSSGEQQRSGVMASWFSPVIRAPKLEKVNLCWDVQSGKNVLGATGGGLYLYFTPSVDLLVGPVYFFDRDLQPGRSRWMWSMQFDADLDWSAKH
jgi:hypothetical protein